MFAIFGAALNCCSFSPYIVLDGPQKRKLASDENSSSPLVHCASSSQHNSDSQHSLTTSSPSNMADSEESNDAVIKKSRPFENGTASSQQRVSNTFTSEETATKVVHRSSNFPTTTDPIRQGFREMLLTSLRNHGLCKLAFSRILLLSTFMLLYVHLPA